MVKLQLNPDGFDQYIPVSIKELVERQVEQLAKRRFQEGDLEGICKALDSAFRELSKKVGYYHPEMQRGSQFLQLMGEIAGAGLELGISGACPEIPKSALKLMIQGVVYGAIYEGGPKKDGSDQKPRSGRFSGLASEAMQGVYSVSSPPASTLGAGGGRVGKKNASESEVPGSKPAGADASSSQARKSASSLSSSAPSTPAAAPARPAGGSKVRKAGGDNGGKVSQSYAQAVGGAEQQGEGGGAAPKTQGTKASTSGSSPFKKKRGGYRVVMDAAPSNEVIMYGLPRSPKGARGAEELKAYQRLLVAAGFDKQATDKIKKHDQVGPFHVIFTFKTQDAAEKFMVGKAHRLQVMQTALELEKAVLAGFYHPEQHFTPEDVERAKELRALAKGLTPPKSPATGAAAPKPSEGQATRVAAPKPSEGQATGSTATSDAAPKEGHPEGQVAAGDQANQETTAATGEDVVLMDVDEDEDEDEEQQDGGGGDDEELYPGASQLAAGVRGAQDSATEGQDTETSSNAMGLPQPAPEQQASSTSSALTNFKYQADRQRQHEEEQGRAREQQHLFSPPKKQQAMLMCPGGVQPRESTTPTPSEFRTPARDERRKQRAADPQQHQVQPPLEAEGGPHPTEPPTTTEPTAPAAGTTHSA